MRSIGRRLRQRRPKAHNPVVTEYLALAQLVALADELREDAQYGMELLDDPDPAPTRSPQKGPDHAPV